MRRPENGFYYHYKHDPAGALNNYAYEVFGLARHSEDKSVFVMYRPLYENSYFEGVDASIRPLDMFLETVSKDGREVPRFAKIEDPAVLAELSAIRDRLYPR
jgi:hypothetical protein